MTGTALTPRILVGDDDVALLDVVADHLEPVGCEVQMAAGGPPACVTPWTGRFLALGPLDIVANRTTGIGPGAVGAESRPEIAIGDAMIDS